METAFLAWEGGLRGEEGRGCLLAQIEEVTSHLSLARSLSLDSQNAHKHENREGLPEGEKELDKENERFPSTTESILLAFAKKELRRSRISVPQLLQKAKRPQIFIPMQSGPIPGFHPSNGRRKPIWSGPGFVVAFVLAVGSPSLWVC